MKYQTLIRNFTVSTKKPIVYNMIRTGNGWRLTAYVPPSAPSKDRQAVIQWLGSYKQQVKTAQPDWVVRFKAEDTCHYELDVLELKVPRAGASPHERAETLDDVWQQMSFNYA